MSLPLCEEISQILHQNSSSFESVSFKLVNDLRHLYVHHALAPAGGDFSVWAKKLPTSLVKQNSEVLEDSVDFDNSNLDFELDWGTVLQTTTGDMAGGEETGGGLVSSDALEEGDDKVNINDYLSEPGVKRKQRSSSSPTTLKRVALDN